MASPPGEAHHAAGGVDVRLERRHVEPVGRATAPYWSLTATTRTPASARNRAASRPTLPKPCTAAVADVGSMPTWRSAASAT